MMFVAILLAFQINIAFSFQPTLNHERSSLRTSMKLNSVLVSEEPVTRRWWGIKSASAASALIVTSKPRAAGASTDVATESPPSVLCDPSVSTWRNPNNGRVVHLLGTAHISSASAEVAGRLVRDTKPSAVFVELDAKRVGRAIPKPARSDGELEERNVGMSSGDASEASSSATSTSAALADSKSTISSTMVDTVDAATQQDAQSSTPSRGRNPFNLKEKLLNQASQVVGNSIKGLYQKLESEGFSAGEEFVVAVKEGLKLGSIIVLGDQDVEVTLRRLTEALSKTDMKKLIAADAEMEDKMKELMPNSGSSSKPPGEMSKDEFTYFVETIKAKENVKMLMANLKSVAPEIYQAMVGERDLYMANGLDKLNQFDKIVAVVGIAHVDGIERILSEKGWEAINYPCKN